jgi:phosphate transport system substrate-binding protein
MWKRLMLLLVVVSLMATVILPATAATLINGAGATFPYPLYAKWFSEYARIDKDVKFTYQAIGSGEGIKLITAQAVDFGATDRYLSDDELKAASGKLLHIPTVMGAVVITYNLPGIGSGIKISSEGLADIYLGKITRWNDPRLAGSNPGVKLPDKPIYVMHRSDSSGTTNIFTDYLSSVNKEWAGKVGKGTSVEWPVGFGGKGNEGVASLVKKTKYALGYVELAHAMQNNLYYAYLMNREGMYVEPTIKAITAAVGAATQMPADYRISLVNRPGKETYPIVGFTWLLVYEQQKDKIKGQKLAEFLTWSLHNGQKLAAPLGYAPLTENFAKMVEKTIKEIKY